MYTGSFISPGRYSIREIPTSTKLNNLIDSIRQQTEAITNHQHTGGNDGTKIEVGGLANNINAISIGFIADQIDSIHASTSPVASKLLALNSESKFPLSVLYTGSGNGLDADKLDGYHLGNNTNQAALSNGVVCTNLNADTVDGVHEVAIETQARTRNSEFVIETRTSDPSNPVSGRIWLRTDI